MRTFSRTGLIGCFLSGSLLFATANAAADPLHRASYRHVDVHRHTVVSKVVVTKPAQVRTVAKVAALTLPVGYVRFLHAGEPYYFSEGRYYQKRNNGFVVVQPRAGFRVAKLPRGYRVIRERGVTYYSFNDVRYRKVDGFFVVV